jgi:hypothetical protein
MAISANTVLRVVAEIIMPSTVIAQNVFYALFLDDGGSNDDEDVVDDCVDWLDSLYARFATKIPSSVDLGECVVYQWDPIGQDWDEITSSSLTGPFVGTDDMLPHGVAPVVTGRTVDPDVNGRKFFPGFQEDQCDGSALEASALSALTLAGQDWVTPFVGAATGSTFTTGVWSPTQEAFFAFVLNWIVNGIIGYQRRRKPGVGI